MNATRAMTSGFLFLALVLGNTAARAQPADRDSCRIDCGRCNRMSVDFADANVTDILEFLAIAGQYRLGVDDCLKNKKIAELKLSGVRLDEVLAALKKKTGLVCRAATGGLVFACDESQLEGLTTRPPKDPRTAPR